MMQIPSPTDGKLSIGKRIAEIAAAEGLTQQSLAHRIGISPGFLSSVIRDLKVPGSEFLFSLKQVFGISVDWLLTGEGSMYGSNRIDVQLLENIRLQYQLWYAAKVEASPAAQEILKNISETKVSREITSSENQEQFSAQCQAVGTILRGAAFLYNSHTYSKDPQVQDAEIQSVVRDYVASQLVPDISITFRSGVTKVNEIESKINITLKTS